MRARHQLIEAKIAELSLRQRQREDAAIGDYTRYRVGSHPQGEAIALVGEALGKNPQHFTDFLTLQERSVAVTSAHGVMVEAKLKRRDEELRELRAELARERERQAKSGQQWSSARRSSNRSLLLSSVNGGGQSR